MAYFSTYFSHKQKRAKENTRKYVMLEFLRSEGQEAPHDPIQPFSCFQSQGKPAKAFHIPRSLLAGMPGSEVDFFLSKRVSARYQVNHPGVVPRKAVVMARAPEAREKQVLGFPGKEILATQRGI